VLDRLRQGVALRLPSCLLSALQWRLAWAGLGDCIQAAAGVSACLVLVRGTSFCRGRTDRGHAHSVPIADSCTAANYPPATIGRPPIIGFAGDNNAGHSIMRRA
jgi:hypothetical protein